MKAIAIILLLSGYGTESIAQETICIKDAKLMNLQVDFQTASLICPKWNVMNRVEYAYSLVTLGLIQSSDIKKSNGDGVVNFSEPCATEIREYELASFKRAENLGLSTFCIQTSYWLTLSGVRKALEDNGTFPNGIENK